MKITVQDYRRTQTKHRKAKKGHGYTKLARIEMDCIWVNLKIVDPDQTCSVPDRRISSNLHILSTSLEIFSIILIARVKLVFL